MVDLRYRAFRYSGLLESSDTAPKPSALGAIPVLGQFLAVNLLLGIDSRNDLAGND
jgi:hypothetical protein